MGIKQLSANPADLLRKRFPSKAVVKAKVISSGPEEMRVSVAPNVDGVISAFDYGIGGAVKAGETIAAMVTGVNQTTFELNLSIRKSEEIQDRKKIQQYLKGAPPLTLGQLLSGATEDDGVGTESAAS